MTPAPMVAANVDEFRDDTRHEKKKHLGDALHGPFF
jgi:hypothetical protein